VRGRSVKGHSHRNTLAVCHHNKLCAFPTLGFAACTAPR
jgi:hypothetical protein